jgi:hypothetical protein
MTAPGSAWVLGAEHFWAGALELEVHSAAWQAVVAQLGWRGRCGLLLDVLRDDSTPPNLAILISAFQWADGRGVLECEPYCWVALCNFAPWADRLRERGFVAIETGIVCTAQDQKAFGGPHRIEVESPLQVGEHRRGFAADPLAQARSGSLIQLDGVRFGRPRERGKGRDVDFSYKQLLFAPEAGDVGRRLVSREERVSLPRGPVREIQGSPVRLEVQRFDAIPVPPLGDSPYAVMSQVCGDLRQGLRDTLSKTAPPTAPVIRRPSPALQATGFRFEDIDLVGLRLDLRPYGAQADAMLAAIIEPLNFHLPAPGSAAARRRSMPFEYRPAARSIVIELLRYGRMYFGPEAPSRGPDPYVSQYELLLRVLVGRVDDGSSQAREPAVFVPAIYVDSTWSKLIGRELQGFEKRLARFEGDGGVVLAAAAPSSPEAWPMRRCTVSQIEHLPDKATAGGVERVLSLELPAVRSDWRKRADRLDADGTRALAGPQWRQRDFSAPEFRRSFARDVLAASPDQFRSIQTTPVDGRPLPKAWITGTFQAKGLRCAFPPGIASVSLSGDPRGVLPPAFRQLKCLLGSDTLAVPTGDWYVGSLALRMKLDEGLI